MGYLDTELKNKKITPISEVDEYIFELNENLRATMVKKVPTFLRENASLEECVLKQLHEHKFHFLGNDGGNNHHPIRS